MSAVISACGLYRYRLEREGLLAGGSTVVIMVNPSTADAEKDDATIRKLRGFAQRHRWGKIVVGNLFAYRATDVRELRNVADPVGPENDEHLARMAREALRVIYAWGPLAKQPRELRDRWGRVHELFARAQHRPLSIGVPAQDGQPRHPLMLSYDSPLIEWVPPHGG